MGWYFTITEEMRALGLNGNDLLVFALINSYSQKGNGVYYGGINFLCEVCGVSRATAMRTLQSLIEKGLLTKNETYHNGVKYVSYQACLKMTQEVSNCDMGSIKMRPNNKIDIEINKERDKRFVPPTVEQVRSYCLERNNGIDPEEFVAFYTSKGWMVGKSKMKDWKSAIITWEKSRKKERKVPVKERKSESVLEHNLRVYDEMFGTNLHSQAYGKKEDYDEQ